MKKILDYSRCGNISQCIPTNLVGSNGTVSNPKSGSANDYNDQINEIMGSSDLLSELEEFILTDTFLKIFWVEQMLSMKR